VDGIFLSLTTARAARLWPCRPIAFHSLFLMAGAGPQGWATAAGASQARPRNV